MTPDSPVPSAAVAAQWQGVCRGERKKTGRHADVWREEAHRVADALGGGPG